MGPEDDSSPQPSQLEPAGAFSEDGVDLTLIRWMLSLSPAERLAAAQDMIDAVWALREGREA